MFPPVPYLFEDQAILVVDKPPGMPVHPSPRHRSGTLIQVLRAIYRPKGVDLKLAHRLDRETSGVVALTKDDECNDSLHRQFRERTAKKTYLALVMGVVDRDEGEIDAPLRLVEGSRLHVKMHVRPDGAPSRTMYRVVERLPAHTLLEVEPLTGRQHQIRAHLAHLGHPIVGDKIYGPDETLFLKNLAGELDLDDVRRLGMPRHALHAHRLVLDHPWWHMPVETAAPLARDILDFMEEHRA